MGDLQQWLAAMPVGEVDEEIDALERKLSFLRTVRDMRDPKASSGTKRNGKVNGNGHSNGHDEADDIFVSRPLTDDRVEIVRAMLTHPQRAGTPQMIADATGKSVRAVQSTLGRMVRMRQLRRVRNGVYQVPEAIAAQVANVPPPARIEGLEVVRS